MKSINISTISRSVHVLLAQPAKAAPHQIKLIHHLAAQQQAPIHHQSQQQQQQQQYRQKRLACNTALCSGKCKKSARRQLEAVSGGSPVSHKHTGNVAHAVEHGPEVSRHDLDQILEVSISPDGQLARIPYMWLRDHCRSKRCFNHNTQQKIPDLQLLERDLTPQSVLADDKNLSIKCKQLPLNTT